VTVLSLRIDSLGSERKPSCVCECIGMIRARDGEANEQSKFSDVNKIFFHPKNHGEPINEL
jgi:hypothetical protein